MKLVRLILRLLSALALLVEAAANLYRAIRNGTAHIIAEVKKQLKNK